MKRSKSKKLYSAMRYSCLIAILVLGLVSVIGICGCGGGGGGNNNEVKKGVFIDSPVQGLNFKTATQSGITDASGKFTYFEGETVEFFLSDLLLGQAIGKNQLSPFNLINGAEGETNQAVVNICRLLQSLDEDGNLNNGIQINEQTSNEIEGRQFDFNVDEDTFINDPDVQALFDTLNSLNVFTDGNTRRLRTAEEALEHLRQQLGLIDADEDGYYATNAAGIIVDCNDTNSAIHPDATEICGDGIDNDCDGQVDEDCSATNCTDADGDGYYAESNCGTPVDCNDTNNAIRPGASDVCGDGIDNDCDGQVDEDCSATAVSGYWDIYNSNQGEEESGPDYWTLTQSGNNITGSFLCEDSETISGTVNGTQISLSFTDPDGTYTLNGNVNGNTMSGNYTGPNNGAWRATKRTAAPTCIDDGENVAILGDWSLALTTTYDSSDDPSFGTRTQDITITQSNGSYVFTIMAIDPPEPLDFKGSVSGSNVNFTDIYGINTLTGTVSADGNSMSGNYTGQHNDNIWGGTWSATRNSGQDDFPDISGKWTGYPNNDTSQEFDITITQNGSTLTASTPLGQYNGNISLNGDVFLSGPGEEVDEMEWHLTLSVNGTQLLGTYTDIEGGVETGGGPLIFNKTN